MTPFSIVIVFKLFPPVSNIIAAPIFQHFEWRVKILSNVSKPWMTYVHRKLHDVTKHAVAFNYKNFLWNFGKKHFNYLHLQRNELKTCNVFRSVKPKTWKNILGGITGRERLIRSHSSARFCFELSGGNFSIQNFPDYFKAFTFCGRHPVFTHYTSAPNVTLFTKFILDVKIYVVLQYMVISRNIISNEAVGNSENILYMHRIYSMEVKLITYHIKVSKFQRIRVNVKQANFTEIKCFEGPSVKSRIMPIKIDKLYGTTFQIIAQVCKEVILHYKGVKLTQIHNQFAKGNLILRFLDICVMILRFVAYNLRH